MNGCVRACDTVRRFSGSKLNILSSMSASCDTFLRSASPKFLSCAASVTATSFVGFASRINRLICRFVTGSSSTSENIPSLS